TPSAASPDPAEESLRSLWAPPHPGPACSRESAPERPGVREIDDLTNPTGGVSGGDLGGVAGAWTFALDRVGSGQNWYRPKRKQPFTRCSTGRHAGVADTAQGVRVHHARSASPPRIGLAVPAMDGAAGAADFSSTTLSDS